MTGNYRRQFVKYMTTKTSKEVCTPNIHTCNEGLSVIVSMVMFLPQGRFTGNLLGQRAATRAPLSSKVRQRWQYIPGTALSLGSDDRASSHLIHWPHYRNSAAWGDLVTFRELFRLASQLLTEAAAADVVQVSASISNSHTRRHHLVW